MDASETRILRGHYGPDWRLQLAGSLSAQKGRMRPIDIEPLVRDLADYQTLARRSADGSHAAVQRYPELGAAIALEQGYSEPLRLLVLADVPADAIAQRLTIDMATVQLWEQLYFDIRGVRGNIAWMAARVVQPAAKAGNAALAARMKLALSGGPVIVDALLDADARLPLEDGERLFRQKLLLAAKFDEAIAMPLASEAHSLKFIDLCLRYQLATKRLELDERKFAEQVAHNHESLQLKRERLAERRREQQRKLEARQAAEAQRAQQQAEQVASRSTFGHLAEQKLRERITASPLAKLTWRSPHGELPLELWPGGVADEAGVFVDGVSDGIAQLV